MTKKERQLTVLYDLIAEAEARKDRLMVLHDDAIQADDFAQARLIFGKVLKLQSDINIWGIQVGAIEGGGLDNE